MSEHSSLPTRNKAEQPVTNIEITGTLVFGSRTSDAIRSRNSIAVCMVVSIVCHLVVGLAFNLRTVLAGRYLAGFFASVPIAVAPRAAFDICDSAERATAIVALVLSLSLGPILGVIGGEFALLIPGSNWRWTIWTAAITSALSVFFALVGSPPTSRPPVRATTQGAQQQPNGQVKNSHLMSKDASARLAAGTGSQRSQGALRSAERIVIGMCGILVYGLLHMLLLVYPMNFEIHRAFPFGISSLPFLAVVAGLMLGGLRLVRQSRLGEDKAWITSPEHSLSATASGIYTLSTGLFIFAWTSHRDTSPWPQISSGVLIGYGVRAINRNLWMFPELIFRRSWPSSPQLSSASSMSRRLTCLGFRFTLFCRVLLRQSLRCWSSQCIRS